MPNSRTQAHSLPELEKLRDELEGLRAGLKTLLREIHEALQDGHAFIRKAREEFARDARRAFDEAVEPDARRSREQVHDLLGKLTLLDGKLNEKSAWLETRLRESEQSVQDHTAQMLGQKDWAEMGEYIGKVMAREIVEHFDGREQAAARELGETLDQIVHKARRGGKPGQQSRRKT